MNLVNTSSKPRISRMLGALVGVAGLATGVAHADGDGAGNDYCVRHTFRLRTNGNIAPAVFMKHKQVTTAKTNGCYDKDVDSGSIAIGVGTTINSVASLAPGSSANATSMATVTTLVAGEVSGSIESNGNADATIAGCPPPAPPRGYGRATAFSATQVVARGRYENSRGNIRWAGQWKNSKIVAGSKRRKVMSDPLTAKLIDNTTGTVTESVLLSLRSAVSDGETSWDAGILENTARNMVFELSVGSPMTVQAGVLRVVARNGWVIESEATGMFAGTAIPPVGAPSGFSVPLAEISIDYDMGADPNHDVEAEVGFDGAGQEEDEAAGVGEEDCSIYLTDLTKGYDGANISRPQEFDQQLGFVTSVDSHRVADDFIIPPGPPGLLDALLVPVYQQGAPELVPLQAAYVRIWAGQPGTPSAIPIAGDMVTNRIIEQRSSDVYRVPRNNPHDTSRLIKNVWLDLSWAPPLPPGQYYLEIGTRGQPMFPEAETVASPWSSEEDNALGFNVAAQNWMPLFDSGSGRPVDLALQVFGPTGEPVTCYANCDGSQGAPLVTPNDFQCFLNRYANGDPYANCDGSTGQPLLSANDFLCFINRAAQGCN